MKKKIIQPSFEEESFFWNSNTDYVVGIDEVGRGAFAGPIVAAGVVFSPDIDSKLLFGINDSKLLLPIEREKHSETIKKLALFWTVESVGIEFINKHGIGKANIAAFRKVLKSLLIKFDLSKNYFILIDGFHGKYLPGGIKKQKAIIKGDQKSLSIASASIIAKVYRDNLMKEVSVSYPSYKFEQNKGYGTKLHRDAIKTYGHCEYHRTAFID